MGPSWRPDHSPHLLLAVGMRPGLALARASFGAPAVAAPELCLRVLGLSRGLRPNPARHFVGIFGVREIALGALADIGDTVMLMRELLCARKVEPGPLILLGTGLTGSAASVAVWTEANRDQGRVLSAS